jgi:hypothetical protein
MAKNISLDERADALERKMSDELDVLLSKSRLPKMPAKPTLLDYFTYRAKGINHLLQSATHALKASMPEKTILACLVHDIANAIFIKQLIEPYVDEEVCWAVRAHQALRFFPDESVGYSYPEAYVKHFGQDYEPDDYIKEAYRRARNHKWYMTARMITVHDIYSFDPNAVVSWEPFIDIVGRNFRQPDEGLGFDNSPVSHSLTSSGVTSGSRTKAWASTIARSRTCGAPFGVRQSISKARIRAGPVRLDRFPVPTSDKPGCVDFQRK